MIPVTKTFLPPIELYTAWVQKAYDKNWLTNRGELVRLLEDKLKDYLGIDWITITNNGTIPLQIALKLLGKGGEVITTPFSYVATTAAIVWEHCTPVFVDIHPEYLTIDETKIEAAITDKTTCILATHVFGNPCAIETIEAIAKKHGLYVIYDAAHSFGVRYNGQSVFNYGDVSTCSFHATKLFHTGEGGAMFAQDEQLRRQLYFSHNFGHNGPLDFHGLGINGINLSGGQKQRISIARELYKDIDILILDEATSALDSETEKEIQTNIDALKGNYTILIIAHRLSTIKNADVVYLMDKGEIIGEGDFEQLTESSERFKKMVELQEI